MLRSVWKWGEHDLPTVSKYTYLGVDFMSNGAWNEHLKRVLDNGRNKVNKLHSVLSNRDINMTARRLLLLSVVRPTLEYGSEVWEGNKTQAASLESVLLGGAKRILGCSSRTCNEAVRGDMGLDTLQGRRDKAKLKWWYKLAVMPEHRYPSRLFKKTWNVKPWRGRRRKCWDRVVSDLLASIGVDKTELLEDVHGGVHSLKSFLALVGDSVDEREAKRFEEGIRSKVKLALYATFSKVIEFKQYLHILYFVLVMLALG